MAQPLPITVLPVLQPEREPARLPSGGTQASRHEPQAHAPPRAWSPYQVWRERVHAPQAEERQSNGESSYKSGRGNP
jgi:hypothetical protein